MRVVVFGASGVQGRHQVHLLARAGHTVVAVSRRPQSLPNDIQSVEQRCVDYINVEAIEEVVQRADRVFVNLPSTSFNPSEPVVTAAKTIGSAAQKANVALMLFNASMPIPQKSQNIKAQEDRRLMRELLRGFGVPVISIEPVVYLDNLLEGWARAPIRDCNTIVYCHKPDLQVSWICHHDVAQIMMATMHRPDLAGVDIAVGGPETVVLSQLADTLSNVWGRPLGYQSQTVEDFCTRISQAMQGRGLEEEKIVNQMYKAYTYYNEAPEQPFNIDMRPFIADLGITLTRIEDWARRRSPWDDKGYY